jgi:hypothetical protein
MQEILVVEMAYKKITMMPSGFKEAYRIARNTVVNTKQLKKATQGNIG